MATMPSRTKFPFHKTLLLGIVISILGLACILQAITGFTLNVWGNYVGTGLWCGLIIFIAGVTGIISSHFRGTKSVRCFFICSALATVMSLVMIVMSSAGLDFNSKFYSNPGYYQKNNKRATFYCYVAALTFSLLSLVGNLTSLFFCVQHNSFYYQKNRKKKTNKSSQRRSSRRNYFRASTNSRSTLQDHDTRNTRQPTEASEHEENCDQTFERKRNDSLNSKHTKHKRTSSDSRIRSKDNASTSAHKDDNKNITAPKREYRSLPNRSKRHARQASCEVEIRKGIPELLPTHFNEDELPSYEEAMCLPRLQKHTHTIPKDAIVNDDSHLFYRRSSEQSVPVPNIQMVAQLNRHDSDEHNQNLQNEEFEMSPQGLRSSGRKKNAESENNCMEAGSLRPTKNENINGKTLSNDFTLLSNSSQGTDVNIIQPVFNLKSNQENIAFGAPISIGSPRSAFTPVKRHASQRASNDPQNAGFEIADVAGPSSQNADSGNVWKNIVLPSVLRTEDADNEDAASDSHPSGIDIISPLVRVRNESDNVAGNNEHLLHINRRENEQEEDDSPPPQIQYHQPPPARVHASASSDTHLYSQIL